MYAADCRSFTFTGTPTFNDNYAGVGILVPVIILKTSMATRSPGRIPRRTSILAMLSMRVLSRR